MKGLAVYQGWSVGRAEDKKRALEAEFRKVALPHIDSVHRAAYYLAKDKDQAEDLVQETYLRAFRFFDKFQPGTNCKAWLLTILRNVFVNGYRKNKVQPQSVNWENIDQIYDSMLECEANTERDNPESVVFSQLLDGEVEKALQELPEEYRTAIVLVDMEDLSYGEAAKVLECPVGTIRSRLSRGRRLLQVALRDYALNHDLIKR